MNDLTLVKSADFGPAECDFWKDGSGNILMTREQIGRALEYSEPRIAIHKLHERNKDRLDRFSVVTNLTTTDGKAYETYLYTTKGVYEICRFSRQPKADEFMDWVWTVVEDIRRHGLYATTDVVNQILADPDFGIKLLTSYKEERDRRLQAERTNAILMHVTKTYTATEIAKELGFRSATVLNRDLAQRRIQYKQNKTWVLYSDYANRGYTEIKQEVLDNGKVIYHRRWTQLGREFLLNLYSEEATA